MIGKNRCTRTAICCVRKQVGETMPKENVVAKNKAYGVATNKIFANQKRLSETSWFGLGEIGKTNAPLTAIVK